MKNYPVVIVLLLVFLGVTAFAISDNRKDENPLPASSALLDRLTDEFLYLEKLAAVARDRIDNQVQSQLAGDIFETYQEQNRELCDLIIERSIPAKRELTQKHKKAIFSLMPARNENLSAQFKALLEAEFDSLKLLINRQKGLIEEREVADFVDQVLISQEKFQNKIEIFQ